MEEIKVVGQAFCKQTFSKFVGVLFKFHEEGEYIKEGYRLCCLLVHRWILGQVPSHCSSRVVEGMQRWVKVCKALAEELQKVEWKQEGLEWQAWQEQTM